MMYSVADVTYKYNVPIKIALLTDLHDRLFEWVIDSLKLHKPDIICIAGDLVDRHRIKLSGNEPVIYQTRYVLSFLRACAEIRPTFMSLGNHEWMLCEEDFAIMTKTGITLLNNSWCKYNDILIGGLSSASVTTYRNYCKDKVKRYPNCGHVDESSLERPEVDWLNEFCKQNKYRILICHHPEYRDRYLKNMQFDMILCGHAHGGQIRFLGQGLFAPGQGVMPKYTSGVHENMIISKGLANTARLIPRLFNPREVVYIEPMI